MKFALALLALVATVSAGKITIPNFGRGQLHNDIQDFIDKIDTDKVIEIFLQYVSEDSEVQDAIAFFKSEEFKKLVLDVEHLPEIKVLMDYIHHAGIDIYQIVNKVNDFLKLAHLTPPDFTQRVHKQISGGIRGLVDDVLAVLPVDELNDLYEEKLKTSPEFKKFVDQLKSDNFQQIVNKVYVHPTFQKLVKRADAAGIDLELIKNLLKVLWGIDVPPRPHFHVRKL
ncbi:Protein G12 [Camponotus japonicus]